MNADLERLIALQKLDTKIAEQEKILKSMPEEIELARSGLEKAEGDLKVFDDEIEADKKRRKELEAEVEDLQDKIAKAKAKLPQVKTNVEYRAILKEQETLEKNINALEDEQLELMEKIEGRTGGRQELSDTVNSEKEKFEKIKAEKEKEIAQAKSHLEGLGKDREATLSQINPSVLKEYEKVLKTREGMGVAKVRENLCLGCNQLIPPQLYYQIRTSDELFRCPHCNRFLYFALQEAENEVQ